MRARGAGLESSTSDSVLGKGSEEEACLGRNMNKSDDAHTAIQSDLKHHH